jgi:hypothetical protein
MAGVIPGNPEGIASFSPALTRQRLRWVMIPKIIFTPTGFHPFWCALMQPVPGRKI